MLRTFLSKPIILSTIGSFTKDLSRRNAGHSKWANIRHIKGVKDAQRAVLFTRLSRLIKFSIQEGGSSDPKNNLKLEQSLEQARRANMPSATIQNIIKSTSGNKSVAKSYQLEIKGPGSCMILVDVFTENLVMIKSTISSIMKKHSSKYSDGGGRHLFEQKGIIEVERPTDKTTEELLEKATDDAIECGAEDVQVFDECIEFHCAASSFKSVVPEIEKLYKVTSASVEFIPIRGQELTEQEMIECNKLLVKLEALPDVVKIYDNVI